MADFTSIPLYRRGQIVAHALVDTDDLDLVAQHHWALYESQGYPCSSDTDTVIYLHHFLLGLKPGDGMQADHINRDRLDNRRSNLRVVTKALNMQNLPSHKDSTSRYRGVHWDKRRSYWVAQLYTNGHYIRLGHYDDEDEAGRVVQEARARLMPYAVD